MKSWLFNTLFSILAINLPLSVCALSKTQTGNNNFSEDVSVSSELQSISTSDLSLETTSDDTEEDSYLKRIIPPTPQSVALARYGEHPVNLSTGLVDISVPIYTIEMGDFKLPITLSYHASGIKVSDIATPVGLGWVLNAGGAITRTVCGAPDPVYLLSSQEANTKFKYRDYAKVKELVDSKDISALNLLTHQHYEDSTYDLESDRYTYSFAGHAGVMQYDCSTGKFIPLNYENLTIETLGDKSNPYFRIVDSTGNEYYFEEYERTGLSDEANPIITSWYLTKINNAYGSITITYTHTPTYNLRTDTRSAVIGRFWEICYSDDCDAYDESNVKAVIEDAITTYTYYKELLVSEIQWDGNKIKFDYANGRAIITGFDHTVDLQMLASINVYNSSSECVKSATLSHFNWGTDITNQRMLLNSVQLNDEGTYTFEYNIDSKTLPKYNQTGGCYSDYWGYYNGNYSAYQVSQEAYQAGINYWENNYDKIDTSAAVISFSNRNCNEETMRYGILEKITYPTKGYTQFTYEPHRISQDLYGGLRIKSIKTCDNNNNYNIRNYEYVGSTHTLHPREMMMYIKHIPFRLVLGARLEPFLVIDGSPYAFQTNGIGCPLEYSLVRETNSDGIISTTKYERSIVNIAPESLYQIFDNIEAKHPLLFPGNCYDEGNTPMLPLEKTIVDSTGTLLMKETYEYDHSAIYEFNSGVRVFQTCDLDDEYWTLTKNTLCNDPYFYYSPIRCIAKTSQISKTVITDYTTSFSTERTFTYDTPNWRTLQPRSVSTLRSDGKTETTTFEYAADHQDASSTYLDNVLSMGDAVRQIVTTVDESIIGRTQIDYATFSHSTDGGDIWALPAVRSISLGDGPLVERERILNFNNNGRPLAIVTNQTDTTRLEWSNGIYLSKIIAPGDLVTTYTHKPLVGVTSITDPSSYTITYAYNEEALLSQIADSRGIISKYTYDVISKGGSSNYIKTQELLYDNPSSDFSSAIQYYDGLGRPTLAADNAASPSSVYNYSLQLYDNLGHITRKTLPAIGGSSVSNISSSEVYNLLKSTYADSVSWVDIKYDALDRPISETTPGDEWTALGKCKSTSFITNGNQDVKQYNAPLNSTSLVKSGYYAASTLQGEISIDEDGKSVTVFKDKKGRKILERRSTNNDTYYVYNDLGQLRFILSPEYQNAGYKDKFAYEYRYDSVGNIVKTIFPGCEAVQLWYDRGCRQIFSQDDRLKAKSVHRFMLYDKTGRLCVQGISSQSNRKSEPNTVKWTNTANSMGGYIMSGPSRITVNALECINYYDNYDFLSHYGRDLSSSIASGHSAMGLLTGTWTQLSDSSSILKVYIYDSLKRVTVTHTFGPFGHESTLNTTYKFDTTPSEVSYNEGNINYTISATFANRHPIEETIVLNGISYRIANNIYDNLGRLVRTIRGPSNTAISADYTYNLHGSLMSISYPGIGFIQNLYYASGPGTPLYNGNISAMSWIPGNGDTRTRGYLYTYDELGRLTEAIYGENTTLTSNPNRYTERVLAYNANGSIKRFQRHGLKDDGVYGKIDNLHITLDGNRIVKVTDDADPVLQYSSSDFVDGVDQSVEYTYDGCGALTSDLNRGITKIEYDNLGYPRRVIFTDGATTEYVYSPSGEKLRTIHYTPQANALSICDTTDYIGAVIYRNGKPDMVRYRGGFAKLDASYAPKFYQYMTDYLGNNRGVIDASDGTLTQVTAYYPFGASYADYGQGASVQPFKFCDKELDLMHGLYAYDFAARTYNPIVPTFDRPDPLADKMPWLSPYAYCGNNPVNYVDPDGQKPTAYEAALMAAAVYKDESYKDYIKLLDDIHG